MRLIIADINSWSVKGVSNGHFIPVAQNFTSIFRDSGIQFRVAGGPVYQKYFSPDELISLPCEVRPGDSLLARKVCNLRNFFALLRNCEKGDRVIFQDSASATLFFGLAIAFSRKTDNFLIQYSASEGLSNLFKRVLWLMASSRIRGLIGSSQDIGESFRKPICVVPDYICTYVPNDVKPEHGVDFSFVGTITPKKGVVEAAGYLARAGYRVLVAGRADAEEGGRLGEIARTFNNLELDLGYLTNQRFTDSVDRGVYSVLNYTAAYSEQSSGIVFDSLFRLRPILGRRCKALQFVEEEGLGVLYEDIRDVELPALLEDSRVRQFKDRIRSYLGKHQAHAEKLRKYLLFEDLDLYDN